MKVVLKHYLDKLEYEQTFKSESSRLPVPTITELADEIRVTRSQLHRILASDVRSLKLNVADDIIRSMRQRGFDMSITDLLEYRD